MSHIGKQPIVLPEGVSVRQDGRRVTLTGPRGSLSLDLRPEVGLVVDGQTLRVEPRVETKRTAAYWGLTRARLNRMAEGVSRGFERKLELEGIGYRAQLDGPAVVLLLGFSHPVRVPPPAGITFAVEKNAIIVSGIDPVLVGDTAARIRRLRPPEPYKGKGVRYAGEVVRRKAGKKVMAAGG